MAAASSSDFVLCVRNTFLTTVEIRRDASRRCSSCPTRARSRGAEAVAESCDMSAASTVDGGSACDASSSDEVSSIISDRAELETFELTDHATWLLETPHGQDICFAAEALFFDLFSPGHAPSDSELEVFEENRLSSRGSALHAVGGCRPCAWFWRPGSCDRQENCNYCHLCPPDILQAAIRERRVERRGRRRKIERACRARNKTGKL